MLSNWEIAMDRIERLRREARCAGRSGGDVGGRGDRVDGSDPLPRGGRTGRRR